MRSITILPALLLLASVARAEPWTIDAAHTRVGFSARHLMVSNVTGRFRDVTGTVDLNEQDLTRSKVELTIQVASVDTENADRDKHLRSGDFFDAEHHPTIHFVGTKMSRVSKERFHVLGDLTIRGVTKPVTLDVTLTEARTSPWGKQVRGAAVTGKIRRSDFGVSWNKALDQGGVVVGDEVTFDIEVELNH